MIPQWENHFGKRKACYNKLPRPPDPSLARILSPDGGHYIVLKKHVLTLGTNVVAVIVSQKMETKLHFCKGMDFGAARQQPKIV